MAIFVDTTPLVALTNVADPLHETAWKDLELISGSAFVLCEPILSEAFFLLRSPIQRQRMYNLLADVLSVELLSLADGQRSLSEIFDWLNKYSDHGPDWADACIAVFSGHNRKLKIWTYDSEFRTIWRRPDGSAIPMAVK